MIFSVKDFILVRCCKGVSYFYRVEVITFKTKVMFRYKKIFSKNTLIHIKSNVENLNLKDSKVEMKLKKEVVKKILGVETGHVLLKKKEEVQPTVEVEFVEKESCTISQCVGKEEFILKNHHLITDRHLNLSYVLTSQKIIFKYFFYNIPGSNINLYLKLGQVTIPVDNILGSKRGIDVGKIFECRFLNPNAYKILFVNRSQNIIEEKIGVVEAKRMQDLLEQINECVKGKKVLSIYDLHLNDFLNYSSIQHNQLIPLAIENELVAVKNLASMGLVNRHLCDEYINSVKKILFELNKHKEFFNDLVKKNLSFLNNEFLLVYNYKL